MVLRQLSNHVDENKIRSISYSLYQNSRCVKKFLKIVKVLEENMGGLLKQQSGA